MRRYRPLLMSLVAAIALVATLLLLAALADARPALEVGGGMGLALARSDAVLSLASVDAPQALAAPRAQLSDPNWHKWINGVAWSQDIAVTAETSDTIKVVDVVTALPSQSI
ncbi:MAG: hypothetical protein JXA89_01015, partial [Anaerolineae bacterium]|nr:hypothetical protein [Anaerolineae bacterium]